MSKASEAQLAELHGVVAKGLTEVIDQGQVIATDDAGTPIRATAPAAYFMAAITLLKNNQVTVDPEANQALKDLSKELANKRAARKTAFSKEGVAAAAELLERDLGDGALLQ